MWDGTVIAKTTLPGKPLRKYISQILLVSPILVASLCSSTPASAQTGTLSKPFAPPPPNAALHYQRALLLMDGLDQADRKLLEKNVWEILPGNRPIQNTVGRIKRMLYRARAATDAAGKGARMETCHFGIDFSDAGASTVLPHVAPMVQLGRLLTLRGIYAQSQGEWDEAAVIFFDGLRMGRHLTHQPTLLEAIAGMQILENNYDALAHWACACPKAKAVARVFGLFEVLSDDLIQPAHTLASESSILSMDFDRLAVVYPRGPWGTVILQSLGKETAADEKKNQQLAVAACAELGVPKEIFKDRKSFQFYLATLKELELRFAEAAATAMRLPPTARIQRSEKLYAKYRKAVGEIGKDNLVNPAEIGVLFAKHETEIAMLRVVLAVAGKRGQDGFPKSLDEVASGFGGSVPKNPYDDSAFGYRVLDDGKTIEISAQQRRVGDYVLPRIAFTNSSPTQAK